MKSGKKDGKKIDIRDQIFVEKFGKDPEIKILLEMSEEAERRKLKDQANKKAKKTWRQLFALK